MIRKAEARDRADISRLHFIAGPNINKYFFASDEATVIRLLERLYDTPQTILSMEYFRLDEENSAVKGAICIFPAGEKKLLERNIGKYVRDIIRIASPAAVIKMALHNTLNKRLPAFNDDELYIEALAVYPEFRGQGVSSALLKYAFEQARRLNLPKISLMAETPNEHAISIYKKYGFVITETVELGPGYRKYNLYGAHKMVAEV